jgi:peptide/nickel transport system ATP-binding protein
VQIDGVPSGHRVACHFAEQIEAGQISRHEVAAQITEQGDLGGDEDFMGPASVQEAL